MNGGTAIHVVIDRGECVQCLTDTNCGGSTCDTSTGNCATSGGTGTGTGTGTYYADCSGVAAGTAERNSARIALPGTPL